MDVLPLSPRGSLLRNQYPRGWTMPGMAVYFLHVVINVSRAVEVSQTNPVQVG